MPPTPLPPTPQHPQGVPPPIDDPRSRRPRAPVREPPNARPPAIAAAMNGAAAARAPAASRCVRPTAAPPPRRRRTARASSGSATTAPGIRRIRKGDGFVYVGADGKRDPQRRRAAAHPRARDPAGVRGRLDLPAPNGHLQATGRDARGRKQYRYHPDWRLAKDADKFERMLEFGAALPRIRKRVSRRPRRAGRHDAAPRDGAGDDRSPARHHLRARSATRNTRATNKSFGLTTLRNRHAAVSRRPPAPALSRQERQGARGRARRSARRPRRPALPGDAGAGAVPVRRRGRRGCAASARPTSTTTSARRAAPTSRPRTSAPGTARRMRSRSGSSTPSADGGSGRARRSCSARSRKRLGNTVAVCKKSYVHPRVLEVARDRASTTAAAAPTLDEAAARRRACSAGERRPARLPRARA